MPGTSPASAAVELAVVERGGFVESRHVGSAIVLAPDGEVVRALGDRAAPMLPARSMKPFQAVAAMTSGVTLRGEDAAIATASHTGHGRGTSRSCAASSTRVAARVGAALPPELPTDRVARDELVRSGRARARSP